MGSRKAHKLAWEAFYHQIEGFWPDLYGTEYALYDYYMLAEEETKKIYTAATRVGHIFRKTSELLRQLPDETLQLLGFRRESIPFLRVKLFPFESVIARLDLAFIDGNYKLLELNADTPTFIRETFDINERVARHFQMISPNEDAEKWLSMKIRKAIKLGLESIGRDQEPHIVFTSHDDHLEDKETVLYLKRIAGLDSSYVPLHELRIVEQNTRTMKRGLYDSEGRKIDLLYRQTYPLEFLLNDQSPDGFDVGIFLLQLWKDRQLAILNPPSAFLLQSKAVQALIWGIHEEKSSFYSEEEHRWISQYFLPTYLDEDFFIKQQKTYVQKPAFGREGDSVLIKGNNGSVLHSNNEQTYAEEVQVYQQFVPLSKTVVKTLHGPETVNLLYTCFLINGEAMGVGLRAGGLITNNLSYFLPVVMQKKG